MTVKTVSKIKLLYFYYCTSSLNFSNLKLRFVTLLGTKCGNGVVAKEVNILKFISDYNKNTVKYRLTQTLFTD